MDDRGVLEINPSRQRLLRRIVEYVLDIHPLIDPDRYRIDEARLRVARGWLGPRHLDKLRISVTYRDVLFLELLIDAAATYSRRRDLHDLEGVGEEEFSELLRWLADEEDRLFRKPQTIH